MTTRPFPVQRRPLTVQHPATTAVSRREFLDRAARIAPLAGAAGVCWFSPVPCSASWLSGQSPLERNSPRARYWSPSPRDQADCLTCHRPDQIAGRARYAHKPLATKCHLCAQECTIESGARGRCRARANVDGELRSLVYGRPLAIHVDPIEKKPFYHFLPGAEAYSLGTAGCPLRCRFCQNWELSQSSPDDRDVAVRAPASMVQEAVDRQAPVIAFTYNEPTVFAEYMLDIASAARARGLRCAMVSCGFANEAPIADLCQVLEAIKIDLKGFTEQFYREVCGASLAPVLRTLKHVRKSGTHLEIVNLVVPTLNDGERSLADLCSWVAAELGPDVPLHFTRFHPEYQLLHLAPTPVATLERARAIALAKGLHYVYVGNVPSHPGNNTYCPRCAKAVVERQAFFPTGIHVKDGRCAYCGFKLAGIWS